MVVGGTAAPAGSQTTAPQTRAAATRAASGTFESIGCTAMKRTCLIVSSPALDGAPSSCLVRSGESGRCYIARDGPLRFDGLCGRPIGKTQDPSVPCGRGPGMRPGQERGDLACERDEVVRVPDGDVLAALGGDGVREGAQQPGRRAAL